VLTTPISPTPFTPSGEGKRRYADLDRSHNVLEAVTLFLVDLIFHTLQSCIDGEQT
jgi:hypothetical protein